MKHMNIVVSVIIAAAILVAAYAVGLLVRHARTPDGQLESAAVTPIESPATLKARVAQQLPGGGSAGAADANLAARSQQEREQMLERMKGMTKEEKQRFTMEEARKHFGAGGTRSEPRKMSPEEREKMLQKWQRMSEEEKRASDARPAESEPAQGEPPQAPANAEGTATQQSSEPNGAEPNKAGNR